MNIIQLQCNQVGLCPRVVEESLNTSKNIHIALGGQLHAGPEKCNSINVLIEA